VKTIRDTPKPKTSVFVLENNSPVEIEISGAIAPDGTRKIERIQECSSCAAE